jgi:hypothetical protein
MKKFIRQIRILCLLAALTAAPGIYAQQPSALIKSKVETIQSEEKQQEQIQFLYFIRTELFFGRNKPDGTEVSVEEFAAFLRDAITPEFPDGLTVLDGIGQFRNADGNIIQEKTKVLILLYPAQTQKQSSQKIERIRNAYKNRFQQQSVLRVDDILPVKVSF